MSSKVLALEQVWNLHHARWQNFKRSFVRKQPHEGPIIVAAIGMLAAIASASANPAVRSRLRTSAN
jgi:hypothetical protein